SLWPTHLPAEPGLGAVLQAEITANSSSRRTGLTVACIGSFHHPSIVAVAGVIALADAHTPRRRFSGVYYTDIHHFCPGSIVNTSNFPRPDVLPMTYREVKR